jgi:hypothetical protein
MFYEIFFYAEFSVKPKGSQCSVSIHTHPSVFFGGSIVTQIRPAIGVVVSARVPLAIDDLNNLNQIFCGEAPNFP